MTDSKAQVYEYATEYGGQYTLRPKIGIYAANDNLCVHFEFLDKESGFWEPYGYATVNTISLPFMEAAIDTNNNGTEILNFLEANGFGQITPFCVQSGFCTFPVFRFNEEKIKQIDPKIFSEYAKVFGLDKQPLEHQISDANTKAQPSGAKQSNEQER